MNLIGIKPLFGALHSIFSEDAKLRRDAAIGISNSASAIELLVSGLARNPTADALNCLLNESRRLLDECHDFDRLYGSPTDTLNDFNIFPQKIAGKLLLIIEHLESAAEKCEEVEGGAAPVVSISNLRYFSTYVRDGSIQLKKACAPFSLPSTIRQLLRGAPN